MKNLLVRLFAVFLFAGWKGFLTNRLRYILCPFFALLCLEGGVAWADPLEAWNPSYFRDTFSANPFSDGGDFATVGVFATPNPNTFPGSPDIGDQTTATALQNAVVLNLPKRLGTAPAFINQYSLTGNYNSAFTAPWQITVSNPNTDNTEVILNTNGIEGI